MFLPKAVYLACKGRDPSVSVCPSSSSQSCSPCQFFSLWLCKLIPGSTVLEQSLFCILPGVILFCSPGIQRRFSFPGMTFFLCQEPRMHSVTGTGPSCAVPACCQARTCGWDQRAPGRRPWKALLFIHPKGFPGRVTSGKWLLSFNSQPGKLYVQDRARETCQI